MSRWSLRGLGTGVGGFSLGPIDLELSEGETVAVLGRSGSGKTTLLRLIAGLIRPARGSVLRDGLSVTEEPPERRRTVYVPQGLGLFPHRSVVRNIAYPLEIAGDEDPTGAVAPLVERFGLEGLGHRRPPTLSGGEQQRVALARALAARPSLLLWDEPLGAVDVLARDELLEALRRGREAEPFSLLLVTHDPVLAYSLADRWLILDGGRTRYLGTPGPLLAAPPDLFSARFAGYDNVYGLSQLHDESTPFAAHLARMAGPGGVGMGAVPARGPRGPVGAYTAVVERVEMAPDGIRLDARAGRLSVRLSLPASELGAPPRVGETVMFDLLGVRTAPVGEGEIVKESP